MPDIVADKIQLTPKRKISEETALLYKHNEYSNIFIKHASWHVDNGWDEIDTALDLTAIPTTLTGKDADTIDTKEASDLVQMTGNQTIAGVKTFSSIPVLPGSNPTANNEVARKAYIDASGGAGGLGMFGDGSDGNVTISSNTTLTRDMFYDNLTVDSGKVLDTDGYRVYAKTKVTNNGTISNNGSNGANGDGGGSSVSGGAGGSQNTIGGGGAGGGGDNSGYGGGGGGGGGIVIISAKEIDNSSGTIESNGGDGGDGYVGAYGNGADKGGTVVDPGLGGDGGDGGYIVQSGGKGTVTDAKSGGRTYPVCITGWETEATAGLIGGGAGGGGGGASNVGVNYNAGGGGGGGGCIILVYKKFTSGTEQCNGGSAGTPYGSGGTAAEAGSSGTIIEVSDI